MTRATERALTERARAHGGLLIQADLSAAGLGPGELRRRVRLGGWQEVLPGVIAPAALTVDSVLLARAAMLWVPAGGLSHYSAAAQAGFWVPEQDKVWLTAPFGDPHRSRPGVEIVRTRHPVPLRTEGLFRWTPPDRTVVDLAQVLSERQLAATLLSAIRKKATTALAVDAAAATLGGRAGLRLLARVTGLWTPARESLLEDALYGDVCAVTELRVERQWEVHARVGQLLGRGDVAKPLLKLVFEADGLLFHSTDEQIAADQQRDRRFLAAGWQTARFREGAFENRVLVRRDIAAIIETRRSQLGAA
jgi:very-short-patch-repair endonuclease